MKTLEAFMSLLWLTSAGAEQGAAVRHAEAFEICEYGTRPDEAMIRKLFPFLPGSRGDARH